VSRGAPLLGEHSREVLAEIGLTETEIEMLFTQGIVSEPDRGGRVQQ
jgi:crotonobetainyl-CoA:carnitine CoA-transferase CaiB-like acyl-CoA transferase